MLIQPRHITGIEGTKEWHMTPYITFVSRGRYTRPANTAPESLTSHQKLSVANLEIPQCPVMVYHAGDSLTKNLGAT